MKYRYRVYPQGVVWYWTVEQTTTDWNHGYHVKSGSRPNKKEATQYALGAIKNAKAKNGSRWIEVGGYDGGGGGGHG